MKYKFLIYSGVLFLLSCSPKVAPTAESPKISFPNSMVEEGYNIHAQSCVDCHNLKNIDNYSREEWDKILPSMAKKAKLTSEQETLINEYIDWELGN
jgi:hypothetical protein